MRDDISAETDTETLSTLNERCAEQTQAVHELTHAGDGSETWKERLAAACTALRETMEQIEVEMERVQRARIERARHAVQDTIAAGIERIRQAATIPNESLPASEPRTNGAPSEAKTVTPLPAYPADEAAQPHRLDS